MFKGLHVDLVLVDELPKCPPIFLCALGGFGNVALICQQEFLDVGSLKFVDHIRLSSLKRRFVSWGFLMRR